MGNIQKKNSVKLIHFIWQVFGLYFLNFLAHCDLFTFLSCLFAFFLSVRLSLIGTQLDKTKEDSIEALSRSQPDLFIGITEPR